MQAGRRSAAAGATCHQGQDVGITLVLQIAQLLLVGQCLVGRGGQRGPCGTAEDNLPAAAARRRPGASAPRLCPAQRFWRPPRSSPLTMSAKWATSSGCRISNCSTCSTNQSTRLRTCRGAGLESTAIRHRGSGSRKNAMKDHQVSSIQPLPCARGSKGATRRGGDAQMGDQIPRGAIQSLILAWLGK